MKTWEWPGDKKVHAITLQAYVRSKVGLPNNTEGTPDFVYFESERVRVGLLLDSLKAGEPTTPVLSSFEQVERYCS